MPFLDELKSNDVPIGMATSAPKNNIDFLLDKVDIRGYFKSIIDDEGVTQGKPHPEIFQKCIAALGVKPNNCVVFEDSISGINSALNAGIKVIALTTTHESSEFSGVEMAIADFTGMNLKTIRKVLSK
jgi:HAD superfamily hydrolase (TIGR01509 family)